MSLAPDHTQQLPLFSSSKSNSGSMTNPFSVSQIQEENPSSEATASDEKSAQASSHGKNPPKTPGIESDNNERMGLIYTNLLKGLRRFFEKNKYVSAVLGLSGGIDSTLTLKIAIDALGPDNVTGIIMPELGLTSPVNIDHARKLCEYFGVQHYYVPINPFLVDLHTLPWKGNQMANMNSKARIRMCILYHYANTKNALVLGTGNYSEIMAGYCTKHGDAACDVLVIGDLLKTAVFELARYLELPDEIIAKKPSAELAKGQTDEEEMGFTYRDLDNVLKYQKEGLEKVIEHGINPPLAHKIFNMIEKNEHKRKLPYVIKAHISKAPEVL